MKKQVKMKHGNQTVLVNPSKVQSYANRGYAPVDMPPGPPVKIDDAKKAGKEED